MQLNEEGIKGQLKKLVHGNIEENLNEFLELTQVASWGAKSRAMAAAATVTAGILPPPLELSP